MFSPFQTSLIIQGLGAIAGSVGAGLLEGMFGPKYVSLAVFNYTRGANKKKEAGAYIVAGGIGLVGALLIGLSLSKYALSSNPGMAVRVSEFFFGLTIAALVTASAGAGMAKAFGLSNNNKQYVSLWYRNEDGDPDIVRPVRRPIAEKYGFVNT